MDRAVDLEARHHAAHLATLHAITRSSPGGRVVDLGDGVTAAITPERPGRSLFNSVQYTDPRALSLRIPDLAALYDDAGIDAWTVWVVPDHTAALGPLLEEAGHVLDGTPELMAAPLDELPLDAEAPEGVTIGRAAAADCGVINDVAFELDPGTFGGMLARLTQAPFRWYGAVQDGRLLSCLATFEHDGDAYVTFVSTHPEGRGRGLAGATLTHALREARTRGCTTTSLEATKMGRPVYARLGYRELGPMQMWERRRAGVL